ncbi:uncharacterized protein DUF4070 [Paraburkholderia caballeronis]|uniref:radical SAM protein n=1 Tax=Paraburkholderia caballeronis TaxID=416943 RepID=UPI001064D166|nr:radical SAM protein [Paraburkholderia caballeronis]TDV39496.1 uncharacterized protein DUF4070 [Paraburkholderia caballeronis]
MSKRLYLINPRSVLPGYFGTEVFDAWGFAPAVGIADLATATVAALAPDDWSVTICDEHLEPVDFECDTDFVGITGKVTQAPRLIAIAAEFRRRGKTVIVGGPYASLAPQMLRDHADILVCGELEALAATLFADLESGTWQAEYHATKPDLADSPQPRWDLYPNDRALIGCVQTSRGCPFECEFCDVIAYLGRHQRHKPIEHVLAELDALYALGYRSVFLADDNFTVYRRRARELLIALRDWNRRQARGPLVFGTQVSIDVARDPELVALCADAGIEWVFVGLETPNEASLKECHKAQNVGVDLLAQVDVLLAHGIAVSGGMIVGFDHDGPDIFARQYAFAMASPIPVFSLGALVAPIATGLHRRLRDAGRLIEGPAEIAGAPWDTNIVPMRMTRSELLDGLRLLCNGIYRPAEFGERVLTMIARLAPHPLHAAIHAQHVPRAVDTDAMVVVKRLAKLGDDEAQMVKAVLRAMARRPHTGRAAMTALLRYAQVRHMYEAGNYWEPRAVMEAGPAEAAAVMPRSDMIARSPVPRVMRR